MAWWAVQGSNL